MIHDLINISQADNQLRGHASDRASRQIICTVGFRVCYLIFLKRSTAKHLARRTYDWRTLYHKPELQALSDQWANLVEADDQIRFLASREVFVQQRIVVIRSIFFTLPWLTDPISLPKISQTGANLGKRSWSLSS